MAKAAAVEPVSEFVSCRRFSDESFDPLLAWLIVRASVDLAPLVKSETMLKPAALPRDEVTPPPSAIVKTAVELSLKTAILPVEAELETTKASAEPEVLPVMVVVVPFIPIVSRSSPIVMVSASVFVPMSMVSQVAELHKEIPVALLLPMPKVVAVLESTDTTLRAPAPVIDQPVELMAVVSSASPIVMVSASALEPTDTESQLAELQMETDVALVLPTLTAAEESSDRAPLEAWTFKAPELFSNWSDKVVLPAPVTTPPRK